MSRVLLQAVGVGGKGGWLRRGILLTPLRAPQKYLILGDNLKDTYLWMSMELSDFSRFSTSKGSPFKRKLGLPRLQHFKSL